MGKGRRGKRSHKRHNKNTRNKKAVEKPPTNDDLKIEFSDEEEVIDTSRVYPNSRNSYSTRPNPNYPGGTSYYNSGRNTRRSYPGFDYLFDPPPPPPPRRTTTTQNRPRDPVNNDDDESQALELYRHTGYDSDEFDEDDDDIFAVRAFRYILIISSPAFEAGETMMNAAGRRNRRVRNAGRNVVRDLARAVRL